MKLAMYDDYQNIFLEFNFEDIQQSECLHEGPDQNSVLLGFVNEDIVV